MESRRTEREAPCANEVGATADGQTVILEQKEAIRRELVAWRRGIEADWVSDCSDAIVDALLRRSEFREAATVACYVSVGKEVRTTDLIRRCWALGKTVCVPAFRHETNDYRYVQYQDDGNLGRGPLGIPEPRDAREFGMESLGLVLVPGLAFDRRCARLGRGKGHYDRMLCTRGEASSGAFKIGLCFGAQLRDHVPTLEHDVFLDAVITEDETIQTRTRERGAEG